VDWLRQAVGRNPMDQRARYNLALALERSGHADEGQQYMREFKQVQQDQARFNDIVMTEIAKRPTDPALHCELGQILLRSGQRDEGMRWIQNALQIDPNYAPARRVLAGYQRPGRPAPSNTPP
jgi:Flp pilus assembly protein TadD